MKRRTLLSQLGGAAAAASLAGCVADRPGTEDDESDPDDDDQPAATGDNEPEGGNESDGDDQSGDNQSGDDDSADDAGVSSPTLTGTEITTHSAECGSSDDAAVAFGDGTVTVEGTVTAPDPCHEAVTSAAEYSEQDDEFRLVVGTTADDAQICSDCIAELSYTVDASFDGGTPINVVVSHETPGDGTKTVAEDSRR